MNTQGNQGSQGGFSVPRAGAARPSGQKPIGQMLVEAGIIDPHQLEKALNVQAEKGGKLVQVLIALGFCDPEAFVGFLARQPGVASIDLSNYEIPRDLVELVPREYALKHEVFPIDKLGKLLTLGMACPLDARTIQELEEITGLRVKPLLCAADDIRRAIHRYYPSEVVQTYKQPSTANPPSEVELEGVHTSLRLGNVVTLLKHIDALPTLPETVHKIRQVMTDPNSSIEDVANIITTDPPIAARILKVANSAAYGFPQRIDNVRMAVSLLGLRETYSLSLSAAIISRYDDSRRHNYKSIWDHSMGCASACKVVAQACGQGRRSSVTSAGLLHDLGQLALMEVAPELYSRVDQGIAGDELVAAEEKVLGISHPEAGYELASHWSLPDEIAQAVRFHHAPHFAQEAKEVVAIVAAADHLYRIVERNLAEDAEAMAKFGERLGLLGLTATDAQELIRQYAEQRILDARIGRVW